MLSAVFNVMWLRLWRDRGALILAFILPGFIFAIFAAIFSSASGGDLDLRVSMALTSEAPASVALGDKLENQDDFSLSFDKSWTAETIKDRVRLGQDDVGLVISGNIAQPNIPSIKIIKDPSRDVAASVLMGQIRQIMADGQTASMFSQVSAMPATDEDGPSDQSVTYYVGATAILFLLFSAMQGASISLDERKSGIADRLLIGPAGAISMLSGKFIFLTLIGFIQAAIIVAVAYIFFDVEIFDKLPGIALACFGAATLSAGLALLVASLCSSAVQMHTVSTFIVLLFSAVGGSMVPRFMMPEWLQNLGQFTPNHWAIEGFYGTLARGQSPIDLKLTWIILFGGASICLLLSSLISHMMRRV